MSIAHGAYPQPCPAPVHASIMRGQGPDAPPRQRHPSHAHHRFVLSDRLLAVPLSGMGYRSAMGYVPYGPNPPFVVRECVTQCPTVSCRVSTRDRVALVPGY